MKAKLSILLILLFSSNLFAGTELIIGGFDCDTKADIDPQIRALQQALPTMKKLGVTSHEVYVRWNLCETADGQFDWSLYDKYIAFYKQSGIKWVPFLICGSAYSLPDWYYKHPGSQGYVCLEHNEQSDVESLWNPNFRPHVQRFIKAFCEQYRDSGVIESILLGVSGNYGEAIYPVSGNDWTAKPHGNYHSHPGYWAGDPYAIKDFRANMQQKYSNIESLNTVWGTSYKTFDEVKPFLRDQAPNDVAWVDFLDWYSGSMTKWASFWLHTTRDNFGGEIYLCTGGDADPHHGSDFGEQCRVAAEVHGGVRITNEGSDYASNFAVTRWVASAARQYGAYFSFEPAGPVNAAPGVMVRIYNATASGAHGLHYYWPNLTDSPEATANFEKWSPFFFEPRDPVREIAVYYPSTSIQLDGQHFLIPAARLRQRFDFDFMSDHMILDGGLAKTKALIVLDCKTVRPEVLNIVQQWMQQGGTVILPDSILPITELGSTDTINQPTCIVFHGKADSEEYRDFLCSQLQQVPHLSPQTTAMLAAATRGNNHFVTATRHGLLCLNPTTQPSGPPLNLPAMSITEQKSP